MYKKIKAIKTVESNNAEGLDMVVNEAISKIMDDLCVPGEAISIQIPNRIVNEVMYTQNQYSAMIVYIYKKFNVDRMKKCYKSIFRIYTMSEKMAIMLSRDKICSFSTIFDIKEMTDPDKAIVTGINDIDRLYLDTVSSLFKYFNSLDSQNDTIHSFDALNTLRNIMDNYISNINNLFECSSIDGAGPLLKRFCRENEINPDSPNYN